MKKSKKNSEIYIEQLKNGQRKAEYRFGDPNCRTCELEDFVLGNEDHTSFVKSLDKLEPVLESMRKTENNNVETKKQDKTL